MEFDYKRKYLNDIQIALSFMVLFTAFNTQSHIQKTLTKSIQDDNPSYFADGYICFGIIYTFLASGMWLSPSVIAFAGWKISMIIGAMCYLAFVTFCYFENGWLTYLGSAITGFGGALLWTSQANYVVLNSEIGKVYHSISIFWMLYEASYLTGNWFVYYIFNDPKQSIDKPMRAKISLILLGFVLVSVFMMFCLRKPMRQEENTWKLSNPLSEVKKAFSIFISKKMLLYNVAFIFCGINLTFMSIIAASLGFSTYLSENSKKYAPLSGVMQGFGELTGCSISLLMSGKPLFKLGLLTIACLTNAIAYIICLLGLPDKSVSQYTDQLPIIQLSIYYFLLANILIGIGDSCLHIEIYNYVGKLYPHDSAPAFAVFKFTRSLAAAASFYYGNVFGLNLQLTILLVFCLGTVTVHYLTKEKDTKEPSAKENKDSFPATSQYYQSGGVNVE